MPNCQFCNENITLGPAGKTWNGHSETCAVKHGLPVESVAMTDLREDLDSFNEDVVALKSEAEHILGDKDPGTITLKMFNDKAKELGVKSDYKDMDPSEKATIIHAVVSDLKPKKKRKSKGK